MPGSVLRWKTKDNPFMPSKAQVMACTTKDLGSTLTNQPLPFLNYLLSRSGWAGNEQCPSLWWVFSPAKQSNKVRLEAGDLGCGVPVWRQQFVPIVVRRGWELPSSLLFVVVQTPALNASPVLWKERDMLVAICTGNCSRCHRSLWYLFQLKVFHYPPGWEGFKMWSHFVGRKVVKLIPCSGKTVCRKL